MHNGSDVRIITENDKTMSLSFGVCKWICLPLIVATVDIYISPFCCSCFAVSQFCLSQESGKVTCVLELNWVRKFRKFERLKKKKFQRDQVGGRVNQMLCP